MDTQPSANTSESSQSREVIEGGFEQVPEYTDSDHIINQFRKLNHAVFMFRIPAMLNAINENARNGTPSKLLTETELETARILAHAAENEPSLDEISDDEVQHAIESAVVRVANDPSRIQAVLTSYELYKISLREPTQPVFDIEKLITKIVDPTKPGLKLPRLWPLDTFKQD